MVYQERQEALADIRMTSRRNLILDSISLFLTLAVTLFVYCLLAS